MLRLITASLLLIIINSCSYNSVQAPPSDTCHGVDLTKFSVLTFGFLDSTFDTVQILSYNKNSRFDTPIGQYIATLEPFSDSINPRRDFNFPKECTTDMDYIFVFSDSISFRVSNFQTEWVQLWSNSFEGYDCSILSYNMNDSTFHEQNIRLTKPGYTR